MSNGEHAKRLLQADSEEQVTTFLNNLTRTYECEWVPIGGQDNNYGVVENQSSSPLGALNEIISNGIDAVLRRRYREKFGDEYDSTHDLNSYKDGSKMLLDGTEEVRVIADGSTGGPTNVTVYDSGEGQTNSRFEETFVGLLKPGEAKQGWPFLQGQFGMGSTGVLPHCGKRGYKAIFSAGMDKPDEWSWTVIRRNREGNAYEYLKVAGEIPSFTGTLGGNTQGSFVKMFDYDLPVHSNITAGLRYKISRTMTEVPVPIVLDERRNYQSAVKEVSVLGFKDLIEKHSGLVERREKRRYDFGGEIGTRDVDIVVFKSDDAVEEADGLKKRDKQLKLVSNRKQRERAIFFTVNGQVHGDLGLSFIKNRCDKYHIAKDTVAFVDFSDFGPAQLTDLFTPARDRLHNKPMAQRLKDGMEDIMTNDTMLVEVEQQRREEFTKDKRDEKMGDMLEELVERNPSLLNYLDEGEKVTSSNVGEDDPSDDYTAPFYPDTLEIIESKENGSWSFWDGDGRYETTVPVNRNRWIGLHLNAQNDFFTRSDSQGELAVQPQEAIKSWGLSNGLLSIQLQPLDAATAGMTLPISVKVDADGMAPLTQEFNISYTDPVDQQDTSGNDDALPPIERLDFPNIYGAWEDDWDDFTPPLDSDSPVRFMRSGDDLEIHVNFDAAPIQNFLSRYNLRKTGKDTIKETWKVGVAMYALSTYIEIDGEFSEEEIEASRMAEVSMRGIVQSMLDQQVSDSELEALTV